MKNEGVSPGDRLTPHETRLLVKNGRIVDKDIAALEECVATTVTKKVPVI
jgi:hypothetical protein